MESIHEINYFLLHIGTINSDLGKLQCEIVFV